MNNKTIHYCWFGGNPKSRLIKKCINSWKRYLPDYDIMEWNESNFDIHCCRYVEEAYNAKKWAFVSDYVRVYVLNKYGGVYFDTDVELLKPLDLLEQYENIIAFEDASHLNNGLVFSCKPNNDFCKWMLDSYHNDCFVLKDGSFNLYTECQRCTDYFESKGLVLEDKLQVVDGYTVFPTEYFCPYRAGDALKITNNTYSIHHYNASWLSKKQRIKRVLYKLAGKKGTKTIVSIKKEIRNAKARLNGSKK